MKITYLTMLLLFVHQVIASSNLVVTYKGETIASVNPAEFTIPFLDEPVLDEEKYTKLIKELEEEIYQKPVNATLDDSGEIVSGKVGHTLHRQKFKELFYTSFLNNKSARIEAPLRNIHPRVDDELLANIRTQQISQYITYFNTNNEERAHNISLAAEAVNNHVVFPGKTFSFNKVVGKRTEEKGYLPAPEIVRGEVSEGIGGGICQVSSTLFNAVDRLGVKIMERFSHSKSVPYVPSGRDATVSWYGPDFTFENNLNQPLLIRAKAKNGSMMIKLYSSDIIEFTPREVPNASKELIRDKEIFGE
ncbi:VanW family protein [Radiobacillus kanasensis]|uniref:VanW family protein n=1 Tax=Radiobacillus kanasensis TaxID=2844358 RepID=UPI001E58C5D3|nr:VanW family protein [Radiobacillus kanasensis]UFT98460.1 VanW family protein [Radiobacillus kanasensis]